MPVVRERGVSVFVGGARLVFGLSKRPAFRVALGCNSVQSVLTRPFPNMKKSQETRIRDLGKLEGRSRSQREENNFFKSLSTLFLLDISACDTNVRSASITSSLWTLVWLPSIAALTESSDIIPSTGLKN